MKVLLVAVVSTLFLTPITATSWDADTILRDLDTWFASKENLDNSFWITYQWPFSGCNDGVMLPVWTTPDFIVLEVTDEQDEDEEFLAKEWENHREFLNKCIPLSTFNETNRVTLERWQLKYSVARLEHRVQKLVAENDSWKSAREKWTRFGLDCLEFLAWWGLVGVSWLVFECERLLSVKARNPPRNPTCVVV